MIYLSLSRNSVDVDFVNMEGVERHVRQLSSRLVGAGFIATVWYAEGSVGTVRSRIEFNEDARAEWQMRRALAAGVVVAWASMAGLAVEVPAPVPLEDLVDLEAP